MKIIIEEATILQVDGNVRHRIRLMRRFWRWCPPIGFYDPKSGELEVTLVHSQCLLEIIKAVGDKFGAIKANMAFQKLTWIYPSR